MDHPSVLHPVTAQHRRRHTAAPLEHDYLLRLVFRGLLTVDWQEIVPDKDRPAMIAKFREHATVRTSKAFWCQHPFVPTSWSEAARLGLVEQRSG